jgi:hypothetical protein
MKRLLIISLLLLLMASPAAAQDLVVLKTLQVQFWPEYDQPAMLVIYDFSLPAEAAFPVDVNVRIPAGAQLLAVAREDAGTLINVSYNGPSRSGDWDILSIAVDAPTIYRIEYYAPLVKTGATRTYAYTWNADYPVETFRLLLQQPIESRDVVTAPAAQEVTPGADGFMYHSYTAQNVLVGQKFTWEISYQKDTDALSASAVGVAPAAPLVGNVDGQISLMNNLPLLLGMLGLVLILGGVVWYWLSGRSVRGSKQTRSRKRHAAQDDDGEEDADEQTYCPQCGKRAQARDRFCRVCGTRLRHGED